MTEELSLERSPLRRLIAMSIPMIVTQYSVAFMQIADTLMVGALGTDALAAISPAGMMLLIPSAFGWGVLASVTAFVGQARGGGRADACGLYAWQGIWFALLFGVAVIGLWPTAPSVFGFFGHEIPVFEYEVRYFRICLFAVVFQQGAAALANFFVGLEKPYQAMSGTLLAVAVNIVLNYLLIFGKLGFPELGFEGAAWGTVAASALHFVFLLLLFLLGRHRKSYSPRLRRPERRAFVTMVRTGGPIGIQSMLDVFSWGVVLIWLVGFFGTQALAAASVLMRCAHLCFLPPDGVGTALISLVAHAIGKGRSDEAKVQARVAFRLIGVYMAGVGGLLFLFRYPILNLFSDDPRVIEIGASAMIFVAAFQIFDAMNITFGSALRGAGDNTWPMLVNVSMCVVIFVGGGLIAVRYFSELGSLVIWAIDGLYVLSQGVAFWLRWKHGAWKQVGLLDQIGESSKI